MASNEDFIGTTVKYYGRQEVDDKDNMTRCILVSVLYESRHLKYNNKFTNGSFGMKGYSCMIIQVLTVIFEEQNEMSKYRIFKLSNQ